MMNIWRRTLRRRSQKDGMTWQRIQRLADEWLPPPQILHAWPDRRFAVNHPSGRRMPKLSTLDLCGGIR